MESIYVTKSSLPPMDEYIDEIKEIWETHWLTNMGSKHEKFRELLSDYLESSNVELFTNGHMALELTIQAYDFPKGAEVITTPFTFASTTHAIVRNGLKPVFCDIKSDDYTIDETCIEALITDNTCAIVPVHVYGNICNIEAIEEIARKYHLIVIYDAAHTFGEKYKGKSLALYGDAACYSFHATKVFNSIEGGACCFRKKEIGDHLYDLKNFGIHGPYEVSAVGANAKMNEFCAAMGICNLRHIDEEIERRKKIYTLYMKLLGGVKGIQLNEIPPTVISNYAYFPIVVDETLFGFSRDDIYERLKEKNIFSRKYFYPLTNAFSCYKNTFYADDTPIAKWISERVLTLPMYGTLDISIVEQICKMIRDMYKE